MSSVNGYPPSLPPPSLQKEMVGLSSLEVLTCPSSRSWPMAAGNSSVTRPLLYRGSSLIMHSSQVQTTFLEKFSHHKRPQLCLRILYWKKIKVVQFVYTF